MDLEIIKKALQQRDKQIISVTVAPFESQNNDIFCIPRNRSKVELVAFIPKVLLELEKNAMLATLSNTRIRYERA